MNKPTYDMKKLIIILDIFKKIPTFAVIIIK